MTYTTTMNKTFNPADYAGGVSDVLAQANLLWSIMNGGYIDDTVGGHTSPVTLARPAFVNAGTSSSMRFVWGQAGGVNEVAGAYENQAVMYADTTPAISTRVNCWDPDPLKRGTYDRTTGSPGWTILTSNISDKAWADYNHPQRLLELLICGWAYSATPRSYQGNPFWIGPTSGDWRNLRMTLDLRIRNFWLGPWAKIGQHVQGDVPDLSAALSTSYPEAPNPKYLLPNYVKKTQLISDQLGFGRNSWGLPNDVPVVRDSGRKQVVIDFTTNDADWECFGDQGRDPTGRLVNYGSAPVEQVLTNLRGNPYILVHHVTPNDGERWWNGNNASPLISEFNRVRGQLDFYGAKLEAYTA